MPDSGAQERLLFFISHIHIHNITNARQPLLLQLKYAQEP